jgi:predicted esterase
MPVRGTCLDAPPPGAEMPPAPKAYTGGTCPALQPGMNTITSDGNQRQFMLVVPSDVANDETLPVVFLWHWLGATASDFFEKAEVQIAVDHYRFAAVIPESKDDTQFKWPFEVIQSQSRIDEELTFFDDMLSCVSQQYQLNLSCVSSVGVSAGALFTAAVLAGGRGEYLSSIQSLSGGTGGLIIKPWEGSAHKMPALVLWGGPDDNCFGVMNFVQTSHDFEQGLTDDGHFFIECIHNCGHAEPPLQVMGGATKFSALWEFALDHPYWLPDGESPYTTSGLPAAIPEWCAIGMGSATPRMGACIEPPGC